MNPLKKIIHPLLRAWIRAAAWFFFEDVYPKGLENIPQSGPVLLASNHPNSFLDALVITAYYKRPIYYIARGDVFTTGFVKSILRFLNLVPIFRREEGLESLSKNTGTFSFCMDVFREDGTILLFSEGTSENEWDLRPLRKGTARLVYDAWNNSDIGKKLTVIPVAIHYSSWLHAKNKIFLSFKKPVDHTVLPTTGEQGIFLRKFNEILNDSLMEEVVVVDKELDEQTQLTLTGFLLKNLEDGNIQSKVGIDKHKSTHKEQYTKLATYLMDNKVLYYTESKPNVLLFLVSLIVYGFGFTLNVLPYNICKSIAHKTTRDNEFYDSVLFCTLLLFYPMYLIIISLIAVAVSHSWIWALFALPILLTAKWLETTKRYIYCYLQRKKHREVATMLTQLFGKGNG